jgi:diguanylate cyclase (GGDEF)-like protein
MSAALPARGTAGQIPQAARRAGVSSPWPAPAGPVPSSARRLLQQGLDVLEPSIGELEPAYRQHFLRQDIDQAIIGLRYILVPTVFFAVSDFLLVGLSPMFAVLAALRSIMVLGTLFTIHRVRRARRPDDLDRALLIWSLAGIASVFVMNGLRPPSQTLQLGIQGLLLLAVYLVIPNSLRARLAMAIFVIVTAGAMHLTVRRVTDPSATLQVWATILLANLMGVAISARYYTLRRQGFLGRVELERTRDNLHAIATTDGLTGLLSRRRLLELAERDLARAQRYERPLSVLALDLDHFKQINDRYGHAAGDAVLIAVADALRAQTRQHDLVGRIGGEELAVILPETGLEAAERLAQRVRMHIAELRPSTDGATVRVTVSLGVAQALPDDTTIHDALKRADRALYRAKEHGRDRVVAA